MKRLLWLLALTTACGPGLNSGVEKLTNDDGGVQATPTPSPSVTPSPTPTPSATPTPLTFVDLMLSTRHRAASTNAMTLKAEAAAGSSLPTGYLSDAAIATAGGTILDDAHSKIDYTGGEVKWANSPCGQSGSVADRLQDCAAKFQPSPGFTKDTSRWDGTVSGGMGEGLWQLVARSGTSATTVREVWLDTRTNLLWSESLILVGNDGGDPLIAATLDRDTALTKCTADLAEFRDEKANLDSAEGVTWRLPTVSDARLAAVNGISNLFADPGDDLTVYWTSTSTTNNNDPTATGWAYTGRLEILKYIPAQLNRVRCVGSFSP